jgi:pimeloyl-ACP methyl ester carboxylesterase
MDSPIPDSGGESIVVSRLKAVGLCRSAVAAYDQLSNIDFGGAAVARIVGIHGAFHELWGPHQVESRWLPALRDGLWHDGVPVDSDDFVVAFYGDIFRAHPDEGLPEDAELLEIAARSGLIEVAEQEIGPGGLEALAAELGAEVLRSLVHQLARYFADDEVRAAVQERVVACINPDTGVIVAHSMGTVVAYEALCRHPDWPVTTLVTLGSPLGGPFVQAKLKPGPGTDGLRPWPATLTAWTNVAASRDSVVADPNLDPLFAGFIEDAEVDNGHRAHDAEPYLNSEITGRAVVRGLNTRGIAPRSGGAD